VQCSVPNINKQEQLERSESRRTQTNIDAGLGSESELATNMKKIVVQHAASETVTETEAAPRRNNYSPRSSLRLELNGNRNRDVEARREDWLATLAEMNAT